MPSALRIGAEASAMDETRPTTISAKYSARAEIEGKRVRGLATTAISSVATLPAKNEPMAARPAPARPCPCAPSVAVDRGYGRRCFAGQLDEIAVVEPPYWEP